jgi:hypothetical protein
MRTTMLARCLVPFLPVVAAVAQSAPAGETALPPAIGPRAAFALAVLEDVVRRRDALVNAGRAPVAGLLVDKGSLWQCGYHSAFVENDAGSGSVRPVASLRNPRSLQWGLFGYPALSGGAAESAFFVAEGGELLWCRNGRSYCAETTPGVSAALAKDGTAWSARLVRAGTSADGEVWQSAAELPRSTLQVIVVDDAGAPLRCARVLIVPAKGLPIADLLPPGVPLAGAVPAGFADVDERGRGAVRGVVAQDLVVRVTLGGSALAVKPAAVMVRNDVLHVAVARPDQDSTTLNEQSAFAMLKNVASGQAQCQVSAAIDADGDDNGEYGFFAELAGATGIRIDANGGVGDVRIEPPVISESWGRVQQSRVQLAGYWFQIFLRDRAGKWVAEHADGCGARGVAVDPDRAEQAWCCFAWPVRHGWTGVRAFFVDGSGDVLSYENADGKLGGDAAPAPWTTEEPPRGWAPTAR